ncbi:MAG: hypothetical protein H0T57_15040 [Rubrobacter sp.]|nr:hypothetical protein [Rubrobacter sp.]
MMKVIERVAEHYDMQEVEFGRSYSWCPECVVVECKCGKRVTLTRSELIDTMPDCECGLDHTASVREEMVLELLDEDYEDHHHPWRYDLQSQADQHLRDEAAYPEDSSWRFNDVTSGLMDGDEQRWKKARGKGSYAQEPTSIRHGRRSSGTAGNG